MIIKMIIYVNKKKFVLYYISWLFEFNFRKKSKLNLFYLNYLFNLYLTAILLVSFILLSKILVKILLVILIKTLSNISTIFSLITAIL